MNDNAIFKHIVNYSSKRFSKNNPVKNVGNLSSIMSNNKITNANGRKFIVDPTRIRVNAVKNQLTNKNAGVFLYMIYYNTKSGKYTTQFIRPNPVFEHGTKHFQFRKKQLDNDIVFATGELSLDSTGHVVYNMLSGTYMYKIMTFYTLYPKPYEESNMETFYKKVIPQILKNQNPFIKNAKYNSTNLVTPLVKSKVTLQELINSGVEIDEIKKRTSQK